jgi:hypothetical protein
LAHIHFNGASGNVTAGKYNNGDPPNRPLLAERLAAGMQQAWETQERQPITADKIHWRTVQVALPKSPLIDEPALLAELDNTKLTVKERVRAARDLTFAHLADAGRQTTLSVLELNDAALVNLPGELFIEYQLAIEQMRGKKFTACAAYGDYGAGYIGTEIAYTQGGYETSRVSRVAPRVEPLLLEALQRLLKP